jgi:hypothetical protein
MAGQEQPRGGFADLIAPFGHQGFVFAFFSSLPGQLEAGLVAALQVGL